uniref:Uncharacterized protein n=1 Tax=Salmonella phage PMBT31 TaxID=3153514 RepID=A0AAU8GNN3_9CAUD
MYCLNRYFTDFCDTINKFFVLLSSDLIGLPVINKVCFISSIPYNV